MIKLPRFIISILLSLMFWFGGCTSHKERSEKDVSAPAISDQVESGEAALLARAAEKGNEITLISQKALASKLKLALEAGGVANAIEFCNLHAYPIIDSLQQELGSEIRRVTTKSRNPNDDPDSLEQSILDAYESAHSKGEKLHENVQLLQDSKHILYNRAITIDNGLCLVCHGTPGKALTVENQQLIRSFYPEDKAFGYQEGDLRGMWSIRIPIERL